MILSERQKARIASRGRRGEAPVIGTVKVWNDGEAEGREVRGPIAAFAETRGESYASTIVQIYETPKSVTPWLELRSVDDPTDAAEARAERLAAELVGERLRWAEINGGRGSVAIVVEAERVRVLRDGHHVLYARPRWVLRRVLAWLTRSSGDG